MLSISNGDPCGILSSDFKLTDTTTYLSLTSAAGTLKTFKETNASKMESTVLANALTSDNPSQPRLVRYLSGTLDVPQTGAKALKHICLREGSVASNAFEGIVDTYIVSTSKTTGLKKGAAYTYSVPESPIVTNDNITSIRNALIDNGSLLRNTKLYNPQDFDTTQAPGSKPSLLYLYKLSDDELTSEFSQQKIDLETTNLKFFSAFLVEYCFYRARYVKMLGEYFDVFQMNPLTYSNSKYVASNADILRLFTGTGAGDTQYQVDASSKLLQRDVLKILAYHMACMKTRMTDMIRLLNSINDYYSAVFTEIQTNINNGSLKGSSKSLQESIQVLNESSLESKKYITEAQFRQGAMEYTQEKNRNANILLGLYAFLNITALAIIFRVANS